MDSQKFGTFIAQCRKDKKMTQADLAAKLNVTDKAISRWERGVGFPDINTIEPLAAAFAHRYSEPFAFYSISYPLHRFSLLRGRYLY